MRALVTGGCGFIGRNIVRQLLREGVDVIVIDDLSTSIKGFQWEEDDLEFHNMDISEMRRDSDFSVFKGVDVVFHTAAKARVQPSIDNPIEYHNVNVNGTLNILKACVDYKVKRLIYSSSSSVYGDVEEKDLPTSENSKLNPMSPYALQKLIGEQYCKLFSELYDLETVCLRYFNVYGEAMSFEGAYKLVIPTFVEQLLQNKPLTVRGDGEQRRDFTYVGDVVKANIMCAMAETKWKGDIFNIGNGNNVSINELVDIFKYCFGNVEVSNVDPVTEPRETLSDSSKSLKYLKWKPTIELKDWLIQSFSGNNPDSNNDNLWMKKKMKDKDKKISNNKQVDSSLKKLPPEEGPEL